ncbi:hypothetical protein Hypma_004308 [Hypsizygus marmoreus]|uniref:Uncharacterized protein n=1 Tax=Hypsizygus marmoreus TaxID=39966 RepID=A0A369K1F8_HYPMA|nr:hypothetical protein Hypma_004308 [Hypsizygus marmoreus]
MSPVSNNIVLPHVRCLYLQAGQPAPTLEFLRPLVLHSLTVFREDWLTSFSNVGCSALIPLIHRSQCDITELWVSANDAENIGALLEQLHHLKVFRALTRNKLPAASVRYVLTHQLRAYLEKLECLLDSIDTLGNFVDEIQLYLREPREGTRRTEMRVSVILRDSNDQKDLFLVQEKRCNALTKGDRRLSVSLSYCLYW